MFGIMLGRLLQHICDTPQNIQVLFSLLRLLQKITDAQENSYDL